MRSILLALAFAAPAAAHETAWKDAGQMILVVTADAGATQGEMTAWTRGGGTWHSETAPTPVTVGRTGVAWGQGLHPAQAGVQKREGDGKAPAGVFALGDAFGYAEQFPTAMRWLAMRESHWCIDVPASPHYNRIVDAGDVGKAAVEGSTEPMRRDLHADGDARYREGFVILHNPDNTPGAGSCIFAHLWKAPGEPTAGCTAMDDAAMRSLLGWLDPAQHPVFVLLTRADHARLMRDWGLPDIGHAAPSP